VPPFTPLDLVRAGSIFVTRPTLFDYVSTSEEMQASATRLFEMLTSGTVQVAIGSRYPLLKVAEAHAALEARKTVGSTVLTLS
jgi:NADPH2:quinone reductase